MTCFSKAQLENMLLLNGISNEMYITDAEKSMAAQR